MNKTYILQIDSPEFPKSSRAVFKDEYLGRTNYTSGTYYIFYPTDTDDYQCVRGVLYKEGVENRPTVWKLKQEKLEFTTPTEKEKAIQDNAEISINSDCTELTYKGTPYTIAQHFMTEKEVVENEIKSIHNYICDEAKKLKKYRLSLNERIKKLQVLYFTKK